MSELPPSNREKSGRGSSIVKLLAVLAILVIVWQLPIFIERIEYSRHYGREKAAADVARGELQNGKMNDLSRLSGMVAKTVGPSVVHIESVRRMDGPGRDDELAHLFGLPRQYQSEGQGSGVIVDAAGYLVTNNHVIDGASEITVQLSDSRRKPARVVGSDPLTDIAVLKIDAENLIAAEWGDSNQLEVGALVWAIGNPFGLNRSVTFGIISAIGRPGTTAYQDFLQTDAAVNPGNSGGPLVNVEGKIVGINTAIVGRSYQGVSFSIPSDKARDVYERIRATGKVARGWLGVALAPLTPPVAKQLQIADDRGALIQEIIAGGPAANAGLQAGDVVVEWNDTPVDNPTTLSQLVAATEIGSQARATIIRDGKQQSVNIQVDERPTIIE